MKTHFRMMNNFKIKAALASFLALVALSPAAHAQATVTWDVPVTISADTDVQTNGTVDFAMDFSSNQTVNGVAFQASVGDNTGNGFDFNDAFIDLGDFQFKKAFNKIRVCP